LSFKLLLRLRRSERSLERALGVVGRRGYELVSVAATRTEKGTQLVAHLELEGGASPETLIHQLKRLDEVESATHEGTSPDSAGDTR
jgi:acetolactate synthase regulatory subunit